MRGLQPDGNVLLGPAGRADNRLCGAFMTRPNDTEKIPACPECNGGDARTRSGGMVADTAHDWVCRDCKARFDDPDWRKPVHDYTATTAAAVLEGAGIENPEKIIRNT